VYSCFLPALKDKHKKKQKEETNSFSQELSFFFFSVNSIIYFRFKAFS